MATVKQRGKKFTVIYYYTKDNDQKSQQWESYGTELEAAQRAAFIGYFEKIGDQAALCKAASEYKAARDAQKKPKDENTQARIYMGSNTIKN